MVGLRHSLRIKLLEIARDAIIADLTRASRRDFEVTEPELLEPRAAFVSITSNGKERGSSGTLYEDKPLHQTVAEMAVAAASADPAYGPLTQRELSRVQLEISVLTPFKFLDPDKIEVGTHGLYIAKGPKRGVLLPQVATQFGWGRERFLNEACKRAGLAEGAWKEEGTLVLGFTADVFSNQSVADH